MRTTQMKAPVLLLLSCGVLCAQTPAPATPAEAKVFKEHPASHRALPQHKPAAIIHNRGYRTRLRSILDGEPNFADHLRMEDWGCGTGCIMIGAADLTTGETYLFPFSLSVPGMGRRLKFDLHSNAIHMVGHFDEKAMGDRWYVWNGKGITLIKNVPLPEECFFSDDDSVLTTAKCNHQPPSDAQDDS